ncbi:MAG TPA: hypothetical protein VJ998_06050 [Pseudomonadales bacterium]|nr:hypothetical protein [Pseudomonadales bacterium]
MSKRIIAVLVALVAPYTLAATAPSMGGMSPTTGEMTSSIDQGLGKGGAMQQPQPKVAASSLPAFHKADANGDGKIEWKEARADKVPRSIFKKEDYENNGSLDQTEWMLAGFDVTEANARAAKSSS